MAIIGGANLKITGTHAGVTLAADGPSQMSLPDVAFFRSFCHVKNFNGRPAVTLLLPRRRGELLQDHRADGQPRRLPATSARLRAETKILYKPEETFEVGGFKVLREGKDLVFVTAGYMVHECLKAADELAKSGKKADGDRRLLACRCKTEGILEDRRRRTAARSSPSKTTTPAASTPRSPPPSPTPAPTSS